MKFWIYFCVAIFAMGCKAKVTKVRFLHIGNLVIADSSRDADEVFKPRQDSTLPPLPPQQHGGYHIYYVGPMADTIKIGHRYQVGMTRWKDEKLDRWTWRYSNKSLKIAVNTNYITNDRFEFISSSGKIIDDSSHNYKSYLLIVQNVSDSAVYLGPTFSLFFASQDTKDRNGDWVESDLSLSNMCLCLTDQPHIYLKPNQVVIAKIRKGYGPVASECRVVLRNERV